MNGARADALSARSHLAGTGWIGRKAESFRHIAPPAAEVWLGGEIDTAAPDGDADLRDGAGWTLQPLGPLPHGRIDARWLDAANPTQRTELFAGLPTPGDDEAAPFAWAHRALCVQGLRLRIAGFDGYPAAGDDTPAVCLQLNLKPRGTVDAPLLVIELEPGVRCILLETHQRDASADTPAMVQNLQVHVRLGQGATLQHVRMVLPHPEDRLAHHVHVRLDTDAHYQQALLAGASSYHLQRDVLDLDGKRANASCAAVLFNRSASLDQQVRATHGAPHTRSDVETLALAGGRAQLVANAYTHIAPGADEAMVRQRLSGVPTDGEPRIVLRPHLEIEHDQVQAAHGATWGALDENALFYAGQRGIAPSVARALLIEGRALALLAHGLGEAPGALLHTLGIDAALARCVAQHLATSTDPTGQADHG